MSQVAVDSLQGITGNTVRCDKCHSPYAIDPAKRKKTGPKSQKPRFRKKLDVETNKILILCNKCGLKMGRVRKRKPKKPLLTEEEKKCYLEGAKAFAESLAIRLHEPEAKYLYCPNVKSRPCGCLQNYINGGEEDPSRISERTLFLTSLLKNAKDLRVERMHTANSNGVNWSTSEKSGKTCRANGNRHSKMFEDFVLSNRKYLREQLKFCERASQRVLMYSNNFLHKELKTMKNQRVECKGIKYARMKPITELASMSCCKELCVQQAVSHPDMLESWRLGAQEGQREARRVLADMLTPSVGTKPNCYRFISLVTGCSYGTICSVKNQLKTTSGSSDPPEHGLKRWWREHPKKTRKKGESRSKNSSSIEEDSFDEPSILEDDTADSDLMAPLTILPPPSYETVVSSKESNLQMDSPNQPIFEQQEEVVMQEFQQQQETMESQSQESSQSNIESNSTLLQNTVQQLLLSPDIISVTVLAAPKTPARNVQLVAMDNGTKEGMLVAQSFEGNQGINSAKLASDNGGNCSMQQPAGEKVASVHSLPKKPATEQVQRRQVLHVFEIPHHEIPPQSSAIAYFAEKAQSQILSILSPSDLEPITGSSVGEQGGSPCMRSVIILPETIVLDQSSDVSKNN